MQIEEIYAIFLTSEGVTTDTRQSVEGKVFFALKGDNFDGNVFVESALEQGAVLAISDSKPSQKSHPNIVYVDNCLWALQDLARYHRQRLNKPVIALTGSNGKTTTKELAYQVLKTKWNVCATKGNLNNHIGVPLTLLNCDREAEILIIEMGANHQNEISMLCSIAQPTHVMVTNIGSAHLEGFGGPEGVLKGKTEMYRYIAENGGTLFVNEDDTTLMRAIDQEWRIQIVKYSPRKMLKIKQTQPTVSFTYHNIDFTTHLFGDYNLSNIAFALAIGSYFNVSEEVAATAVAEYKPSNQRSQVLYINNNTFVLDAYNANPSSMVASIDAFLDMEGEKKMLILGDMLELGDYSKAEHQRILDKLATKPKLRSIFVGKIFYSLSSSSSGEFYESVEQAKLSININQLSGYTVLLKGSRGVALERLIM